MSRELAELEARAAEIERSRGEARSMAEKAGVMRSQEGNRRRLRRLEADLSALGDFREVTPEDEQMIRQLESELEAARTAEETVRGIRRDHESLVEAHGGRDTVRSLLPEMRRMVALREAADEAPPAPSKKPLPAAFIIGVAMVLAGVAGVLVHPASLAIAAAGAVLAFLSRRGRRHAQAPAPKPSRFEVARESVMTALGTDMVGPDADTALVKSLIDAEEELIRTDRDALAAGERVRAAERGIESVRSAYGPHGGYDRCAELTASSAAIRREIASARAAIESAGLDPDGDWTAPEERTVDDGSEVHIAIGRKRQELRTILDTSDLERVRDRVAALESRREEVLRRGAVLAIAAAIVDEVSGEAYSTVGGGVVETADRYLSLMTSGRYAMEVDPRLEELAVHGDDGVKTMGQWSTGLTAQVMLSLKLAIAREMEDGQVPVILDDVLLTFDSERKEGACRALSEISREMQVIMFTCDFETVRIFEGIGGARLVGMGIHPSKTL